MRKLALLGALLMACFQAAAATLGPVTGSVLIGRPLDVQLQTQLEPGQGLADLCVQPQLMYGEQRVAPANLSVTLEGLQPDGRAVLRVRSSELINEPVITLTVSVGCQAVFQRAYTLLPDAEPVAPVLAIAERSAPPGPPALAAPVPGLPAPLPERVVITDATPLRAAEERAFESPIRLDPPRPRPAEVLRLRNKASPRALAGTAPPTALAAPVAPAAGAMAAVPPPPPGSRLQLDPVPLPPVAGAPVVAADAVPGLAAESAPSLAVAGAGTDASVGLEQEVAALRAEQERLRLALESAQAQLLQFQQAQAPASGAVMWPGFISAALALLLLGGLWYALRTGRLMLRRAGAPLQPWWHTSQLADAIPMPADRSQPPSKSHVESASGSGVSPAVSTAMAAASAGADAELAAARAQLVSPAAPARTPDPGPDAVAASLAASAAASESITPHPGSLHAASWGGTQAVYGLEVAEGRPSMFAEVPVTPLDAALLLEVWQQADFFESIAQTNQAMEVLAQFVHDHPRASEAPYLRWQQLEAQSGRVSALGPAARAYENHFLRLVPGPEGSRAAATLDDDASFLRTLQAHWPLQPARDALEQALASQPGEASAVAVSVRTLAAFDDMLFLLALLDTLAEEAPDWAEADALALPSAATLEDNTQSAISSPPRRDPMSIDFDLSRLDAISHGPAASDNAAPPSPVSMVPPPSRG